MGVREERQGRGARVPSGRRDGVGMHVWMAGGKGGGNWTAGAKLHISRAKGSPGHSVFWGDWTGRSRARCLQELLMKGFQYEDWGVGDRGLAGHSVEAMGRPGHFGGGLLTNH